MGDGIEVTAAELVVHASHVDVVGDAVVLARDAAVATTPGPEAYGRLCTVVPVLLNELQSRVVEGIDAAGESLHDTGRRLRAAADDYDGVDGRSRTAFDRVRGAL